MRFQKINITMASVALAAFTVLIATAGIGSERATLKASEHVLQKGDVAEFAIMSNKSVSSDLHAWCEVEAGGSASLTFDGDHYIPLSEPAIGDIITLKAGESRRYQLDGSIEANKGDAYIAFAFTDVPAAMCFPGMQCNGAAGGAKSVKVSCGNN